MNKPINVTKTITTLTEWRNEETRERIQYESDKKWFYFFDSNQNLILDFDEDDAPEYLQICDEAVKNNLHRIAVCKIENTSFLSMVLTQFLHKAPATHNDETHN